MSPRDEELLNQLGWEYVLAESEGMSPSLLEKVYHQMISHFGNIETDTKIKEMKYALELMGIKSKRIHWDVAYGNILSGYSNGWIILNDSI
jgi:hypothetical protein